MEPLIVSGTLDSLRAIAQYVRKAATIAGLEKKTTYKLRLSVDEIATNIITHGYEEAGIKGDIEIQAHIDNHTLKISIEDTGIPYNPTQKPPQTDLDQPLEERSIGGLGIYLAIQDVDEFIYERNNGRNHNILVVYRVMDLTLPIPKETEL
jgi:serine/threonine-protein kinase RsbW